MKKNIVTITPTIEKNDNLFTVYPATEFIPDWYRTSPSNNPSTKTNLDINTGIVTTTYKMCTPFQDAMTAGYIICTSADIEVSNLENGKKIFLWKTNRLLVSQHISWQVTGLPIPEGYLDVPYKFINEFKINTPKGISMLFINPINRYDLPFSCIGGIIDTDRYDQDINFPFLIKNNFTGIIPKGTPIIQMIPFERKTWGRQYRKFDLVERQNNLDNLNSIIRRAYKNIYWVRKEYK